MLKSIAKSASSSKRERAETSSEEDADEFNLGAEDANAKRAKRSLGMKATMNAMVNTTDTNNTTPPPMKKADPDSSFITSSLRKSKKSKSDKEENGGRGGRQLRFTATANNSSKQAILDDDEEIGGDSTREEGDDDAARTRTTRRRTTALANNANANNISKVEHGGMMKRGRKRFIDSIFSPMFSFLSGRRRRVKKSSRYPRHVWKKSPRRRKVPTPNGLEADLKPTSRNNATKTR